MLNLECQTLVTSSASHTLPSTGMFGVKDTNRLLADRRPTDDLILSNRRGSEEAFSLLVLQAPLGVGVAALYLRCGNPRATRALRRGTQAYHGPRSAYKHIRQELSARPQHRCLRNLLQGMLHSPIEQLLTNGLLCRPYPIFTSLAATTPR